MPRPLDPIIADKIAEYGLNPNDSKNVVWDCHGTWVIYHKALERIAAAARITFGAPQVLEANGGNKSVALCVTGAMGERSEWSVGEASSANCKNAYPYAMAEKRAKDRVILKLIGLHGSAYSEEEADDFKAPALTVYELIEDEMTNAETMDALKQVVTDRDKDIKRLTPSEQADLRKVYQFKAEALKKFGEAPQKVRAIDPRNPGLAGHVIGNAPHPEEAA